MSKAKQLTLSLIIPVYNEEHYLAACLEAVAKQSELPDEVIVIDNNSTDKTTAIVQQYPFVKLLREPKQSVVFARNRGFNAAKSDIIGRIDADTVLPADWVKLAKQFLKPKDYVGVTGPVGYYDMPLPRGNHWIDHQIRKHLYRGAPHVPFLFGSNSAILRDAWQKVAKDTCSEKAIHEDLDLAIHLSRLGTIHYDKALLAATSARRYDDNWRDFSDYMNMYRLTYRRHGIKSIVPRIATLFYWLGYLTVRPFRLTFNPITKRHSLRYALKHHRPAARKNPMA